MHCQESNANLYLQKSKGGRGFMEVESVYKLTKIKVAHYMSHLLRTQDSILSEWQTNKIMRRSFQA